MDTAEALTARIIELLQKIEAKIEDIERLINDALSHLPAFLGYIADKVRHAWNAMLVKVGEFWDWFADKLTYVGNPWLLNSAANEWRLMGGKVARINETIADLNLSVDDDWSGRAADQYKESIQPQRDANSSIMSDFADNIASAMSGLAGAIVAFWICVGVGLLSLIGAIIGAAVTAATVFGLPATPVLIVVGIVIFLGTVGGGLITLYIAAGNSRTDLSGTTAGVTPWPRIATQ